MALLKEVLGLMLPSDRVVILKDNEEIYRGYQFFSESQAKDFMNSVVTDLSIESVLVKRGDKEKILAIQNELQEYPATVKNHEFSDFQEMLFHRIKIK